MTQKLIKRKNQRKSSYGSSVGLAEVLSAVDAGTKVSKFKYSVGDTVRVHVQIQEGDKKRIQAYEGVVIKARGKGVARSFTVRKISHGVGVERVFLEVSPKVTKVEVLQSARTRRAKLYFLRKLAGKAARLDRREVQEKTSEAAPTADQKN